MAQQLSEVAQRRLDKLLKQAGQQVKRELVAQPPKRLPTLHNRGPQMQDVLRRELTPTEARLKELFAGTVLEQPHLQAIQREEFPLRHKLGDILRVLGVQDG
jgi:hypothetical protein